MKMIVLDADFVMMTTRILGIDHIRNPPIPQAQKPPLSFGLLSAGCPYLVMAIKLRQEKVLP